MILLLSGSHQIQASDSGSRYWLLASGFWLSLAYGSMFRYPEVEILRRHRKNVTPVPRYGSSGALERGSEGA